MHHLLLATLSEALSRCSDRQAVVELGNLQSEEWDVVATDKTKEAQIEFYRGLL